MPIRKKGNKFAIGSGRAIYKSKAAADKAYKGYLASKKGKRK